MTASLRPAASVVPSLIVATMLGTACLAEEAPVVVRGTDGLVEMPFTARNTGSEPIGCAIATAHWYSVDLGTAGPGEKVQRDLWADPATGDVFVLNDKLDRMPVQSLWCGFAGRAWATRSAVTLDRRKGMAAAPIVLACQPADGRLSCR